MSNTLQSAAPSSTPASSAELDALLHEVAVATLSDVGWVRVTGSDRVRWLNGMITNSVAGLAAGEGCYNFVLNAQGRIQGDLTAFLLDDSILLETSREQVPALLAHFDRFIIMDDVELAEVSEQRNGILLAGPNAFATVQQLGGEACSANVQPSTGLNLKQTTYRGAAVDLIQAYSPMIPRYEVWADDATIALISDELASLQRAGAEALETLRVLEGTPRYGTDIRNTETARDLPQETAQTRALHFAKGCYLGQEIVERIRSRGNVHRMFAGFRLDGAVPAAGAVLQAEGKAVGELTSIAPIQTGGARIALGYVRREALDRRVALEYAGGKATPVSLPYEGIC